MIDYSINPVLMGGLVKEVSREMVKIHLHGRLGVITVPKKCIVSRETFGIDENPKPGCEVQFYFSYLQVTEHPYDYDSAAMDSVPELIPSLLGGILIEVNDTAVKAEIMDGLGYVSVPRRWVFTNVALKEGQNVEFYLSPMMVAGE